ASIAELLNKEGLPSSSTAAGCSSRAAGPSARGSQHPARFLRLRPSRSIGTRALRPRGGRLRLTCAVGFGSGDHLPNSLRHRYLGREVGILPSFQVARSLQKQRQEWRIRRADPSFQARYALSPGSLAAACRDVHIQLMEKGAMADEPRRLSDFLRAHRERILSDWVDAVRVLEPAKDLDQPVLLDSLPQFLDELADFLDDVRAGHPAKEPVNPHTIHALDRLEVGYDLTEVVEEYAILRRCIVELVHDEGAPAMRSAQLARLHAGIDSAIVTSTARYHQASERTLRALERISSTALTHGEAEAMLPELLKVLLETCASVDAASLLLLEGEVLRVHAAVGLGLEQSVGESVPVGHSLAGQVAQTRAPIAIRDAASDPMVTRESIRQAGLRGYYGVPMMLGEELVGVATIGSRHAAEFSEEDRLLFRTMSGRAAALIAKARLNAELTRRNAELSAALDYRDRMLGILSHDLKS